LVIPQAADQTLVAAQVARSGAGIAFQNNHFSAMQLHSATHNLLYNRTYTTRAIQLGHALRAAGGSPRAADLVEASLN
jgi:zeaxanthin glucosyltransferase